MDMAAADVVNIDVGEVAVGTDITAKFLDRDGAGGGMDGEIAIGGDGDVEGNLGWSGGWTLLNGVCEKLDTGTVVGLVDLHVVGIEGGVGDNLGAGGDVHGDRTEIVGNGERRGGTNGELHFLARLG
jgi:hypothetical protein